MSTAKRKTRQRMAILAAIKGIDCAFTPQEILDRAQRDCPGLGIATVYRSISELLDQGRIRGVVVADAVPRYERTDVKHHHHFHCASCGAVTPLTGCSLKEDYRLPPGFNATSHDVTFTGACPACSNTSP